MKSINARSIDENVTIDINKLPDTCPHCHYSVSLKLIWASVDNQNVYLSFFCPRNDCEKHFIYQYNLDGSSYYCLERPVIGNYNGIEYSPIIRSISTGFVNIYNQSEAAESYGLRDICGVGYRKALEFLIKDYIISSMPALKLTVENKLLAACISDHIDNQKIVAISKRAVWLGNDETHYIRKWEGMDITHLKQLIALTAHWIETEELTKEMIAGMPDPKKK